MQIKFFIILDVSRQSVQQGGEIRLCVFAPVGNIAPFEKCCSGGEQLAPLRPIKTAQELNLRPPALAERNVLPLDFAGTASVFGDYFIAIIFSRRD